MRSLPTPLGAIARGLAAGVIGTAAMTLHQKAIRRIQSSRPCDRLCGDGDAPQDPWKEAPAPALVGKRVIEGVFHRRVPADRIGALTTFMHWAYGIAWGGVYGTVQGTVRANPALLGPSFGAAVWAASYAELVPMGLYDPPWNYPPKTLANDLGYHATYGAGVAAGYLLFEHIWHDQPFGDYGVANNPSAAPVHSATVRRGRGRLGCSSSVADAFEN